MKVSMLAMVLLTLMLSSTAFAVQDPEIQYLMERLKALEETVSAQKEEIRLLKDELGAMKATRGYDSTLEYAGYESHVKPLTESGVSSEELRHAVRDYLSTEEGKRLVGDASPARIKAGYKVGKGFYLQDLDDKFKLVINNRAQIRYTFKNDNNGEDTSSFRIRRHKVKFTGHAFTKDLTYKVQWNLPAGTGDGELEDVMVNYKISGKDWLQIRGGQWKVPYNRQELTSSGKQQFVDRSIASEHFNLDRDIGVMLHGKPFKGRFEYYLAMMQGAGINQKKNTNNEHLYAARFAVNPFGKFKSYSESDLEYEETPKLALGAAYALNNGERMFVRDSDTTFNRDLNVRQATVDFRFKWRGFSFLGDYFWRDIDAHTGEATGFRPGGITENGHTFQAGYFVPLPYVKKHLELAARYSYFDPDTARSHDSETEWGLGVNWFFKGHNHKLQSDVRYITQEQDRPQEDLQDLEVRMQYQLVF